MFETSPVFYGEPHSRCVRPAGWRLAPRSWSPRRSPSPTAAPPMAVPPAPPPPGLGSWPQFKALLSQLYGAGPALTP